MDGHEYTRVVRRVSSLSNARGHVRALGFACALVAQLAGCSGRGAGTLPTAALSSTPEAEAAFAPLRARWSERRQDRAALEAFVARFPDDGAAPLAKVYLAFEAMSVGDFARADGILSSLGELRRGATRDLATIARARSLRSHGAPRSALDSLRPLAGKIIDEADREVFLEELALAAIGSREDAAALGYLDAWLRGVSEDERERVRAKIAEILAGMPRNVLEETYRAMRMRGAASGYSPATQRLVAARLARIAVETDDAALARWLLDVSGASAQQTGGEVGVELGELATSRRGLSAVEGRTVGLLLPTRDRALRDEGADVVRGLSWALDLPRSANDLEGVRLVTREDGVDQRGTDAALDELTGEGAVLVVGGFDRASADRAAQWSERTGVPVLLLATPSVEKMPKRAAVVLGERVDREVAMLAEALLRHGARTVAVIADTDDDESAVLSATGDRVTFLPTVRCDVPISQPGQPRFPVEAWRSAGAQGWLIAGPSSCARDALRDIDRVRLGPKGAGAAAALTLEAGLPAADAPAGLTIISASAGIIPVDAAPADEPRAADVKRFVDRFGARPSYWTALGRDGGALARVAMAPLPPNGTTDDKQVAERRALAARGLLEARVRLWTTDADGLAPDRILARALRVVTWSPDRPR